jgi:uncharacterized protein (DUF433 family)
MVPPIKVDREIMSGTPCFNGTRVPVKTLFDYLEGDYNIPEMLEQFPTVTREQVDAVLELCFNKLMEKFPPKTPR